MLCLMHVVGKYEALSVQWNNSDSLNKFWLSASHLVLRLYRLHLNSAAQLPAGCWGGMTS
jgi:hypothetical protein